MEADPAKEPTRVLWRSLPTSAAARLVLISLPVAAIVFVILSAAWWWLVPPSAWRAVMPLFAALVPALLVGASATLLGVLGWGAVRAWRATHHARAVRQARLEAGSGAAENELHQILAVVPADMPIPPDAHFLQWIGEELATTDRLRYVRRAPRDGDDMRELVMEQLHPVVGEALAEEAEAYRATAAAAGRAPAATGVRVVAMAFVTRPTGTSSTPPETLAAARALLRAIERETNTARLSVCVVPEQLDEALDPVVIERALAAVPRGS